MGRSGERSDREPAAGGPGRPAGGRDGRRGSTESADIAVSLPCVAGDAWTRHQSLQ